MLPNQKLDAWEKYAAILAPALPRSEWGVISLAAAELEEWSVMYKRAIEIERHEIDEANLENFKEKVRRIDRAIDVLKKWIHDEPM